MTILPSHRHDLAAHRRRHGEIPWLARETLIGVVEAAGLSGRGGAGFPLAVKLRAVTGRRAVVVANGCEGDPHSAKDRALLTLTPHLVLDGIQLAAFAVGATEAVLCLHSRSPAAASVAAALAERADRVAVRIAEIPRRYVASEETALVHYLTNGDARPTGKTPRPAERGVKGRPTLVSNVETLAQIALVARLGPGFSRTGLFTVTGAVHGRGVVEAGPGSTIGDLISRCGGESEPVQAVLAGGYGGRWLPWPAASGTQLETLGISAIFALPAASCGLEYTARVLAFLAAESARQCGPCMFGLPAIAHDFAELVRGGDSTGRLARRLPVITGRGACGHPDGAVRLADSALRVFGHDVSAHLTSRRCQVPAGVA
ncbi:MAG TPA: NADH-ubiquinone oxidoreductase-F iron-sulfur binding region domain-containing protein [Amycolatopsis sp.]|nr:NADH-ubiquinone oxidoreductase-F iron-sulfur binding region domain-containing protein [Amycolatopsis sp.]